MKREGIGTLFIHGFPWALSYLLDHLLLFEIVLCVCDFLKVFLKMELRNGSRFYKNAYKVFVSKIVQRCVCEMCFLKVILKSTYSKGLKYAFPPPLDIAILPLIW